MRHRRAVFACLLTAILAVAGAASAQTSFYVYLTNASILGNSNTFQAHAWMYYRDSDCTPGDPCDRNVLVEFTLHRGYRTYGSVMVRPIDKAGQYGSGVDATFRLPDCRLLKKKTSQAYTVDLDAAAPDGSRRHATRTVYQRSCAR